ncbi:Uncharacterized protein FKW44_003151 [Caligus rogercresseyi]|uniref:Uncharacterized protein n=1 Tax=Caligus rogercresseyi TaxID=217165 RepID=A0A7T8QWW8_CALRO|nr:Uncharacterized protein FKW44_003151 [Caligus rogercresseyi]
MDLGQSGEEACSKPHPNVTSLKSGVDEKWTNMSMGYEVKVCAAFSPVWRP